MRKILFLICCILAINANAQYSYYDQNSGEIIYVTFYENSVSVSFPDSDEEINLPYKLTSNEGGVTLIHYGKGEGSTNACALATDTGRQICIFLSNTLKGTFKLTGNAPSYRNRDSNNYSSGRSYSKIQYDLNKARKLLNDMERYKQMTNSFSEKRQYDQMIIKQQEIIRQLEKELRNAR